MLQFYIVSRPNSPLDVLGGVVDAAVILSNDSHLELPIRAVRNLRVPGG
jgi:hypothetical protein